MDTVIGVIGLVMLFANFGVLGAVYSIKSELRIQSKQNALMLAMMQRQSGISLDPSMKAYFSDFFHIKTDKLFADSV